MSEAELREWEKHQERRRAANRRLTDQLVIYPDATQMRELGTLIEMIEKQAGVHLTMTDTIGIAVRHYLCHLEELKETGMPCSTI